MNFKTREYDNNVQAILLFKICMQINKIHKLKLDIPNKNNKLITVVGAFKHTSFSYLSNTGTRI